MIKGKIKKELSKEEILKCISSYDIYRYYHGPFKINVVSVNRHRGEKDPSLIIGNKISDQLTHMDFGDMRWRGDCFSFVEQIFNVGFHDALLIINRDFNLGLTGEKVEGKNIITWKTPEIVVKDPPLIQVVTRPFNKEEFDYWGCYYQGEEDIKRENIYVPSQIWRNKKRIPLGDLMTFCYYYPELDKWKIYRPHAKKRDKDTPINMWKWDTNLPFNYIENLEAVKEAPLGILSKSKKDRMVLMKALEISSIASVQAEDPSCITKELLDVFDTCKKKLIVSDNDKKGKSFSWWLTDEHCFKHCNVPDKYLSTDPKCTDFADLACVHDLEKVRKHFKNKRFIQ